MALAKQNKVEEKVENKINKIEDKEEVKKTKKVVAESQAQPTKLDIYQNNIINAWTNFMSDLDSKGYTKDQIQKGFGNAMTNHPEIKNTVLKNLQTSPYLPDRDTIEEALEKPYSNEKVLRQIGRNLFNTCYPLYKQLRYYDGELLYRNVVMPQNVKAEFMKKPRFTKEENFVNDYIEKLNPPYQFRRIVQEVLQSGKRAYVLMDKFIEGKDRKEDVEIIENGTKKIIFEESIIPSTDNANRKVVSAFLKDLPDDYIKIVGKSSQSYYTVAFDFGYFLNNIGADIDEYPSYFREYLDVIKGARKEVKENSKIEWTFDEKYKDKNSNVYKLSDNVIIEKFGYNGLKSKRTFYCWVYLPSDNCQVFSVDESTPLQASNFMGLFLMSADLQMYNLLQQQLTSVPLYSMVIGQIPNINNDRGVYVPALSPDAVNDTRDAINDLMPNGARYTFSPATNNTVVKFDEQPNATKVYTSALQGMVATSGMAGLLVTTDKPSLAQIKTSQLSESRFIDVFYEQFKDFVNRRLDQLTEQGYLRYDWKFYLYGYQHSEKEDMEFLFKLLGQGITSVLPFLLGYLGITLRDATTSAEWVKASGIYDKFLPLISSFQQSGNGDNGRPEKSDSDVDNDNTAKSKEAGTNKEETRVRMSLNLENILKNIGLTQQENNELSKKILEMLQDAER